VLAKAIPQQMAWYSLHLYN